MAQKDQEYIELKIRKEKQEAMQRRRIERIADRGCEMMKVIQEDEIRSK